MSAAPKMRPVAGAAPDWQEYPPVETYVADDPGPAAKTTSEPSIDPLDVPAVSTWSGRELPPPRDWICPGIALAAGRVATMGGNGGTGKTLLSTQIAVACATSRPFCEMPVNGGAVLGIHCEDEGPELERRTRQVAELEGIELEQLDNLHLLSRDGEDNVLAMFERDHIVLTKFYHQLDATIALIRPRLTIIDTAADVFAGDFMSTTHVRQFIKVALGGLAVRHGTAILLLAHPSASAMANGDGGGFSTAWNNSVRSRLFLRAPKTEDADAAADRRVLEIRKSNYGPTGGTVPLLYDRGRFVLDADPISEGTRVAKAAKVDYGLGLAVITYFRKHASSGQVVTLGKLVEVMQASRDLPVGEYDKVRKPVQRALEGLIESGLVRKSDIPRGYRIAPATSEAV